MFDFVIRNGTVVLEQKAIKADIGISGEKIVAVFPSGESYESNGVFDAEGCFVIPGGIDTHTHFFEPGESYREDFRCGSKAAASGGYTTVMEMPNSNPSVLDKQTFQIKNELASRNSVVDYALWGGATAGNFDKLEELAETGCIAFKGFTVDAGPGFLFLDKENQQKAMKEIVKTGRVLGFHAEENETIQKLKRYYSQEPWNLKNHEQSRPYYAELTAIFAIIAFSKETGCPVHICHLSIPEGAELIQQAKKEGVNVTVESCSHYFTLNYEDQYDCGTYALIQPPLRDRKRMEKMWNYLFDGTIDYLGTDHAPYLEYDKEPPSGNLWNVIGGAPSIDVALPIMFDESVLKRGMSPVQFAQIISTNAAKRFGFFERKGSLFEGKDADITVIDPQKPFVVHRANSFSKSKCTKFPYEGRNVNCSVVMTMVRGNIVYSQNSILVPDGYGKLVKPVI